jgi:hypothetical protein
VPLSSLHLLLPLPASSLSFHSISIWDPSTTFDMHHFFSVLTFTSAEMCCHAVMIHWHRGVTLGIIVLLAGVIAHFPRKIRSSGTFFILLWGACLLQYLIPEFLKCPAGMTTQSVFMEHHIWFMVLNVLNPYYINVSQLFCQEHPLPLVPHYCQPVLLKFIGLPILQVGIWQWFL